MVVSKQTNDQTIITLSPNCSATWQQSKFAIIFMVSIVMTIAFGWTLVGAWVVLPFAGFEVGLFAYIMHRVSVYTHTQEIIYISPQLVNVETGYRSKHTSTEMLRAQIDVFYSESDNNWELPKIAMCTRDRKIEIGNFLNLDDRKHLKSALENAGFIICRNKWWQD
jgi:uncharacterized membrane protein